MKSKITTTVTTESELPEKELKTIIVNHLGLKYSETTVEAVSDNITEDFLGLSIKSVSTTTSTNNGVGFQMQNIEDILRGGSECPEV